LVFTGDEYAEGGKYIVTALDQQKIKASFFFTGRFYRNTAFTTIIQQLKKRGHYLGAHSDQHLLYCDWVKRDSLLVTKQQFANDLLKNYSAMEKSGIKKRQARFFLPPYEWYNDSIAAWTKQLNFQLINYTPGTRSHADYTTPPMKNYASSNDIAASILNYEKDAPAGLNGFILLVHIGAGAARTDKFYHKLPEIIAALKQKGYQFIRVDELLTIK
jgi:endoglucanase